MGVAPYTLVEDQNMALGGVLVSFHALVVAKVDHPPSPILHLHKFGQQSYGGGCN